MTFPDRGPVWALFALAGFGLLVSVTWVLRQELILLFAAGLFGSTLYALSTWLAKRTGLGRKAGVITWYVLGLLVAAAFAWLFGQSISGQYGSLTERIPAAMQQAEQSLQGRPVIGTLADDIRRLRVNVMQDGDGAGRQTEAERQEAEDQRSRFVRITLSGVSAFLIWTVLSFYFAYDGDRYVRMAVRLAPPEHREMVAELLSCLGRALPWWLVGQLASMGVVAGLTALGLIILGIPVAFSLGLIAGLFSFVPFLGPLASTVPAVLVTLEAEPGKLVWVLGLFALVQFAESYVLTPFIQNRVVSVLPVILISAQVVMGVLVGLIGVMFATPLALTLMVTVQIVYLKHGLGEKVLPPRAE